MVEGEESTMDCPVSLPEHPVPEKYRNCEECGLHLHGTRMIWGEGNPAAPLYIILDNPGMREDREGKPFVCGTRITLQEAVIEAGIRLEEIYVTYILKRKPVRAYPKEETRAVCFRHLLEQIETGNPKAVMVLGNVAVQSYFQEADAEVKHLRGRLHLVRGWLTAVSYHPLAVRRRPNLLSYFQADWQLVARHLHSIASESPR